jgi:putative heme-binding domain-containing protein
MRWFVLILSAFGAVAQDGQALYQKYCSYCHGARGEGGRGPDLTLGRYRHGGSDAELFTTIRNGVRGTEMPAVRATDDEVRLLVAFVKTLAVADGSRTSGNAAAGAVVFVQCAGCHPGVGPELSIAGRRGAAYLRDSLLKPEAEIAIGYRAIGIRLRSGTLTAGVRLNEDDISVQIRDMQGNLRSFLKADVVEIVRDRPSLMPSFQGRLTEKQIEDVIAFVMGMR